MKRSLIPFLAALALTAHPMGNFSVSHFTRFDVEKKTDKSHLRPRPSRDPDLPANARLEPGPVRRRKNPR